MAEQDGGCLEVALDCFMTANVGNPSIRIKTPPVTLCDGWRLIYFVNFRSRYDNYWKTYILYL